MQATTIKLSPKFQPLWRNKTRYFVLTGGRGSGKSFANGLFVSHLLNEPGEVVLYTRYTMTSAALSVIPEFMEKVELQGWGNIYNTQGNSAVNTASASVIHFRGLKTSSGNQTANLKSLQGVTCWVLDEAEELTDEDMFDKIDLSVRSKQKHNRVIIILNPATKEHWIYKRFFEQAGVEPGYNGTHGNVTYIHTTWEDNRRNLNESFIAQAEHMAATNPAKYQHVMAGGWLNRAEGVVFPNWRVGDFDPTLSFSYGLDHGYSVDPAALVKVAVDERNKLIYLHEELYERGLGIGELRATLLARVRPGSLIVAESAQPMLNDELRKGGQLNIVSVKKPEIMTRVQKMLDYTLVVTPESTNLATELNNYRYADKGKSVIVDAYNHLLDAAGYNVYHNTFDNFTPIAF